MSFDGVNACKKTKQECIYEQRKICGVCEEGEGQISALNLFIETQSLSLLYTFALFIFFKKYMCQPISERHI